MERKLRCNNIIIFGIQKAPNHTSSLLKFIVNFLNKKLEVSLNEDNINNIYKLKINNQNHGEPIKVEFVTYWQKSLVFNNCAKLKNTSFYSTRSML